MRQVENAPLRASRLCPVVAGLDLAIDAPARRAILVQGGCTQEGAP